MGCTGVKFGTTRCLMRSVMAKGLIGLEVTLGLEGPEVLASWMTAGMTQLRVFERPPWVTFHTVVARQPAGPFGVSPS